MIGMSMLLVGAWLKDQFSSPRTQASLSIVTPEPSPSDTVIPGVVAVSLNSERKGNGK